MSNSIGESNSPDRSTEEPRYAADEIQPESAIRELAALTEREDGTIRGGALPANLPGGTSADAVPIIKLTPDESQPIDAIAESNAQSEREDGTNIG